MQEARRVNIPSLAWHLQIPQAMDTRAQQLRKDAAHARRLAERASDAIAQELLEIAEQLEKAFFGRAKD